MASTFDCSFLIYRAFDEPKSDVIGSLEALHQAAKEQSQQFPNTFQYFHDLQAVTQRSQQKEGEKRADPATHYRVLIPVSLVRAQMFFVNELELSPQGSKSGRPAWVAYAIKSTFTSRNIFW